jgi:hypothetical protein
MKSWDFLLFSGRSGKPQSTQRDAEKNNNPLRSSASSAVNLFCHDPLIQNKLKNLEILTQKYFTIPIIKKLIYDKQSQHKPLITEKQ